MHVDTWIQGGLEKEVMKLLSYNKFRSLNNDYPRNRQSKQSDSDFVMIIMLNGMKHSWR